LKKLMRKIDRFCITHPRFGIPNLMLYLVIGTGLVWLLGKMDTSKTLLYALEFNAGKIFLHGQIWRLVTFVFIPDSSGIWLLIALYFYYFIGKTLESHWGPGKFLAYYLSGMLCNILFGTLVWLLSGWEAPVSAMYLNLSMFFAFATLFPETVVLLFFIIPVKIKWLAYIAAAYFALVVLTGFRVFPSNLLPVVAVLNYLLFCGDWLFDKFRPSAFKQKKKTIDFKKAAREYNRQQANKPYTHKCEVCGRTDREYPDLEFRFCSKCIGYHCFCVDHINSHIHFKE